MEKITITASKTYDVLTGSGLLPRAGAYIRQALGEKVRKICVVTDSNVAPLYSDALISSLEELPLMTWLVGRGVALGAGVGVRTFPAWFW